MAPRASILVGVTRSAVVGEVVDCLLAQTVEDWEAIFVCQRGATVDADDPRITVVHSDRTGRSAALNDARTHATAPILATIDDDGTMGPNWLAAGLQIHDDDPAIRLWGGSLIPPERTSIFSACPQIHAIDAAYQLSVDGPLPPWGFQLIGANTFMTAELFDLVGGFDEDIGAGTFYAAAEDLDFAVRAKHLDVKMASSSSDDLAMLHTHGERTGLGAILRHHRGYARGEAAFAAKVEPTGLEPDVKISWVPNELRAFAVITHLLVHPARRAAYKRYRTEHGLG